MVVIRDDPVEAQRTHQRTLVHHHGQSPDRDLSDAFFGPPDAVAECLAPYVALGFRHLIVNLLTPYDFETVEKLITVCRWLGGGKDSGRSPPARRGPGGSRRRLDRQRERSDHALATQLAANHLTLRLSR